MTKDEILLADQSYFCPAVFHYYRAKDQSVYDIDGPSAAPVNCKTA